MHHGYFIYRILLRYLIHRKIYFQGICERPSTTQPLKILWTYWIYFHWEAHAVSFPVGGCLGRASSWTSLRFQFIHLHIQDKILVPWEGNFPLTQFQQCGLLVSWEALNRRQLSMEMCANFAERKHMRRVEEKDHASTAAAFQAYGRPLEAVN